MRQPQPPAESSQTAGFDPAADPARESAPGTVQVGAVGYLNARPHVYGLAQSPRFAVRFDVPSRCAELLHAGAIDLGLIPSIEYLRGGEGASAPSADSPYCIVPGVAIASLGPVRSVALYTKKPVADIRSISLDTSSRTSVALVRVLCQRSFGIHPSLETGGPDLDSMLTRSDAALLIGDSALLEGSRAPLVEKIDLGEVWTRMTGLPFVYAFWAGRPEALNEEDVRTLQGARDEGVAHLDEIANRYFDTAAERRVAADYLRNNIRYHLGPDERAALELFYRYAADAGVVEGVRGLRFYEG
jgi:chorismate dehydratase